LNGNIYAVDGDSGDKKWEYDTGKFVASPPAVLNGTLYIGDSENLLALAEEDA